LRIVCLSAETADLCARLGAWDDVVAVSAYAIQEGLPPKPIASGFSSGSAEFILKHQPDLVLGYSDVQADLAAELIRAGATVLVTNQRTLPETCAAMRLIGNAIGRSQAVSELVAKFERELNELRRKPANRLRVYFEEWPEPPISGIAWVVELIELIGGIDVFASRRGRAARERMVTDEEIRASAPEVIFASWCGKPVDMEQMRARLSETPAVNAGRVFEIASADILQPGFRVLRGARLMHAIITELE
jgi:iron complex transport system substrate-binding protein